MEHLLGGWRGRSSPETVPGGSKFTLGGRDMPTLWSAPVARTYSRKVRSGKKEVNETTTSGAGTINPSFTANT